MKKIIAIIASIGLSTASLKANNDTLKNLQVTSPTGLLIAKRFLQERAYAWKKSIYHSKDEEKLSSEEKIFEKPFCEIHDMTINARREECDGQETIILETKVFGTIDDFEDLDVIEAEKRLLKFVLIKAYRASLTQYTKNKKSRVALILDNSTKVVMQPDFLIIQKGSGYFSASETSTDRKGMLLLTVFSKTEFDALIKQYFDA